MAALQVSCVALLCFVCFAAGQLRGPPGSVCSFVASRQISYQVENRRRRDSSPGVWDYIAEVIGTRDRYRRAFVTVYGVEYFEDFECCLGWNRIGDTCQADCYFPCNNGLCVSTNVCECDEGWEGQNCDEDVDECWYMIDECDHVNGGCVNTQGSYNCTCNPGLNLINGTFCHAIPDTDECGTGNGGCDHNCHNTHGSFTCSCNAGFNLDRDGRTCVDINECSTTNGGCDHFCDNTVGGRTCRCRPTHRLVGETTCRDDDMYPYGEEVNEWPRRWDFSVCQEEELPPEGFRFFGRRHHNIHICDNGIVSFDDIVRPTWPTLLQEVAAYSVAAVIAPFLARSNPTILDILPEDERTQIFYSFYQDDDGNPNTNQILSRARDDGRSTPGFFAPNYEPVWALVVTWTRVPPDCSMYINGLCPRPHDQLPVNDFQLVISTDGILSFANFIYPARAQQWVSPDEARAGGNNVFPKSFVAVGGYSAGDGTLFPFRPATNASLIHRGFEFSGEDNRRRPPGLAYPVSMRNLYLVNGGNWKFALQDQNNVSPPEPAVARCSQWMRRQIVEDPTQLFGYDALPSTQSCPCTAEQAWFDSTYNLPSSVTSRPTCATSRRRVHAFVDSERLIMSRMCCYQRAQWWTQSFTSGNTRSSRQRLGQGALQDGIRGGHLIINNQADDQAAFQSCCVDAAAVRNGWYCDRFVLHRPLSSPTHPGCTNYGVNIPWTTTSCCDPHLTTLDGNKYSFNGLGDFLMADVDNGEYQLQCRMSLAAGTEHATIITTIIAYQKEKQPIQIQVSGDSDLELYVNGSLTDLSVLDEEGYDLEVGDNALVTKPANNSLLVIFFSGITIQASARKGMLFIDFSSPPEFLGKIRGLLGKFDGDKSNDFEGSDGVITPVSASEQQLYEDFGITWQLTSEDGPRKSLFPNNTEDSFQTRSSFYPQFTDAITFIDPHLESQAYAICKNNTECLFDISQTGDISYGHVLLEADEEFRYKQDMLNMFPPTLNGPGTVYATVGTTVTIVITATDPSTRFPTFALGPEVPDTVELRVRESEATLIWQVTSASPFKLQVDVYNAENTTAQYWPVVYMCSCQNGGNCDSSLDPDPSTAGGENKFFRRTCTCAPGYAGDDCGFQVDACLVNLNPCFPGSECTDLPPPAGHGADGYTCGPCPDGYTGDGINCQDRDECAGSEGDICQHVCRNFLGGFDCICNDGYILAEDDVSCNDFDECRTNVNNCSQQCTNTDGAFDCACRTGFVLAADGEDCEPVSPCSSADNPGCDSELGWCTTDGAGTVECSCRKGYQLGTDGVTCEDEDECLSGSHHCEQLCNNTAGGYSCYCRDGYYTIENYVVTCIEIDECSEGYHNCTDHERCVNDPGSFHCQCKDDAVEVNGICLPVTTTQQVTTGSTTLLSSTADHTTSFPTTTRTSSPITNRPTTSPATTKTKPFTPSNPFKTTTMAEADNTVAITHPTAPPPIAVTDPPEPIVTSTKPSPTGKPTSHWTAEPEVENVVEVNTIVIEVWSSVFEIYDQLATFKRAMAAEVTTFCAQQVDRNPACRRVDSDRRRRSYSASVFLPEDVHVTEGYPQPAPDSTRTALAFFMVYSDTGDFRPVPLGVLTTVVQQSQSSLEAALNSKQITYIGSLDDYLDDDHETPTPPSSPDETDHVHVPMIYVTVGATIFLVMAFIIAVTFCLWVKKKSNVPKVDTYQFQAVPLTHSGVPPLKQAWGVDNPVIIMDTKA